MSEDIVAELDWLIDEYGPKWNEGRIAQRARDEIVTLRQVLIEKTVAHSVVVQLGDEIRKHARAETLDQVEENLLAVAPLFPQISIALTIVEKMKQPPGVSFTIDEPEDKP